MKELGESQLANNVFWYDGKKNIYTAGPLPFDSGDFEIISEDKRKCEFKVTAKFVAKGDIHHLQEFLQCRQLDLPQETKKVLDKFYNEFISRKRHCPEDIVMNILPRFPAKTLMRLQSVCLLWKSLISSRELVQKHLNIQILGLLVRRYVPRSRCNRFDFFKTIGSSFTPIHLEDAERLDIILGPVEGIFLLNSCIDQTRLWNPATRKFKHLPGLPTQMGISRNPVRSRRIFGFGVHNLSNRYWVIWVIMPFTFKLTETECPSPFALLFEQGENFWRHLPIDDNIAGFLKNRKMKLPLGNAYCGGSYYWAVETYDGELKRNTFTVISFNRSAEKFALVECPPNISDCEEANVTSYEENLAMVLCSSIHKEKWIEIWVMRAIRIWSKQCSVRPLMGVYRVVGVWQNQGVFVETGYSELFYYDANTNQAREIGSAVSGSSIDVFHYKESVFPLED